MMTTSQRLAAYERFNNSDDQDGSDELQQDMQLVEQAQRSGLINAHTPAGGMVTSGPQTEAPGPVEMVLTGGNRLTVAEIERRCAEAQKRESLLHDDAWKQIRSMAPGTVKAARGAVGVFNQMQELYFPIWNPMKYRESLMFQLENCREPGELVALNAKLAAWNSTTPDVMARTNRLWNTRVAESWIPLLKDFMKQVSAGLKVKIQDIKERETKWLAEEFGMAWAPTPATVRILQIKREFDAFERNANEQLTNPLRNTPGNRLELVGSYQLVGTDAHTGALCIDEPTATDAN